MVEAHRRDGRDEVLDSLAALTLGALRVGTAGGRVVKVDDTGRRAVGGLKLALNEKGR